ncbi:hypothetical protein PoMZ_13741, partial [Pyricularia oryzae]
MLEKNIYRPSRCPAGLAPNSAIANQAEYPSHLSVEKYKGLRSIPSGHIIQWQNILLQLAMPIVDFRREETSLIVLQAMYQTGPSNDDKSMPLRQAHSVLDCAEFCAKLVGQLQSPPPPWLSLYLWLPECFCFVAVRMSRFLILSFLLRPAKLLLHGWEESEAKNRWPHLKSLGSRPWSLQLGLSIR